MSNLTTIMFLVVAMCVASASRGDQAGGTAADADHISSATAGVPYGRPRTD